MVEPVQTFNPIASSIGLHPHLTVALYNKGLDVDVIFHGKSGVISIFATRQWQGKGFPICDIYPTQANTWVVEWLDGKTMTGSGGNHALVKLLIDGIEKNIKWAG